MSNWVRQPASEFQSQHLVLLNKSEGQIQAALGPTGDAKRFVRLAMTEFRSTPKLMQCSPESFMLALYEGARLGLEIGKQLGQYWLIPRGQEVVPMLGYKGMIALGLRHPDVQTITSTPVFKGDFFEHGENMQGQFFEYRPCGNKVPGDLEKVFAVCRLKSGGVILDVMERAEIEAARAKSQMPNGPAWRDSYSEMARKTVIRRLFKYIPLQAEAAIAIARDEERWESSFEEKRDPNKYKSIVKDAGKISAIEAETVESNSDKERLLAMAKELDKKSINVHEITGFSILDIQEMAPGPKLTAAADKVAARLEDLKSGDGKK
jgi:recombination protein RecT